MHGDKEYSSAENSSDPFLFIKNGGKKIVNFAITNHCNAKCTYCKFHLEKEPQYVTLENAKRAIDYLLKINTGVLALTGGEPLLHPQLPDIIKYARNRGLIVYTGTNSLLLTTDLAAALKEADVTAVWISFESSTFDSFNKNRGIPNLNEQVKKGLKLLKNAQITTFAISLINKSITNFVELEDRLIELGFEMVKFDYPMAFNLKSSYKGWSESPLLKYSASEMKAAINDIISQKKANRIKIINPSAGLLGAVDFYQDQLPRFPCYAGEKVLYLDWNLNIYRCPALGEVMGSVGDEIEFNRIDCNKCYYQGVRDYDSFYYFLEKFQDMTNGLLKIDPKAFISTMNPNELKKLYSCFQTAKEIRECGLV